MGTIRIESQASSSFFSYQLDAREQIDGVVKGMLDYNRIPGLLQPVFSRVDDIRYFRYDITAYTSLRELCRDGIRICDLIRIMLGIGDCLDRGEEYLIPAGAYLLEPEYIFADSRSLEAGLVCLPVLREAVQISYSDFFLDLMTRNRVNTEQYGQYYPEIINYLNGQRGRLSLREFTDLLQRCWDKILVDKGSRKPLSASLVSTGGGAAIPVSGPVLRIGRDRQFADHVISNKHISGRHAQIEARDGEYTLTDLGSSNGTFVNGEKLKPNNSVVLRNGDMVAFSDERFIFRTEDQPLSQPTRQPESKPRQQPILQESRQEAEAVEAAEEGKKKWPFGFGVKPKESKKESKPAKIPSPLAKSAAKEEKSKGKKGAVIGGAFIPGKGKVGTALAAQLPKSGIPEQEVPDEAREERAVRDKPASQSRANVDFGNTIYLTGENEGTHFTGTR